MGLLFLSHALLVSKQNKVRKPISPLEGERLQLMSERLDGIAREPKVAFSRQHCHEALRVSVRPEQKHGKLLKLPLISLSPDFILVPLTIVRSRKLFCLQPLFQQSSKLFEIRNYSPEVELGVLLVLAHPVLENGDFLSHRYDERSSERASWHRSDDLSVLVEGVRGWKESVALMEPSLTESTQQERE